MAAKKELERRRKRVKQLGESISEPDLTTAERYPWIAGYPPGFTVDELRWYRKKKPPGDWGPRDNLKPEEGSMKKFKTEYGRCYKPYNFLSDSNEDLPSTSQDVRMRSLCLPNDYFKIEGELALNPVYNDLYVAYPTQKPVFAKPKSQLQLEVGLMDFTSEKQEKYVSYQGAARAQLARRSSSLHRDGEFTVNSSEMRSKYVKYDNAKHAELSRRPTSLHMDAGDMESVTSETAGKFIEFLIGQRPDLTKAPRNNLTLEGSMSSKTEQNEKYVPLELQQRIPHKQQSNIHIGEGLMDSQSEKQNKFVPFNVQERRKLAKRDTNLHLEGLMDLKTEKQDKFVPYNVGQRTALLKRDTTLHLDGKMATQTEQHEKYVPQLIERRPKLTKRSTNLKLEGDMEFPTEQNAKYMPFEVQKRAPLARKDTNLQLESNSKMTAQYPNEYVLYEGERAKTKQPTNHFQTDTAPERQSDKFFAYYQKPFRSFESTIRHDGAHVLQPKELTNLEKRVSKKENIQPDSPSEQIIQSKLVEKEDRTPKIPILQVEGQLDTEFTNSKLPREHSKGVRMSEEEVKQKKRTRNYAQPVGNLRSEGQMASDPEYRSSYVDFPRERPVLRKPENSLKTEGNVSQLSEKEAQYIEHSYAPRPALVKREDEMKMEGRFQCQPEYRKAYIDFLTRENMTRKSRPYDNLTAEQRAFDVMYSESLDEPVAIVQKQKLNVASSKGKQKASKSPRGCRSGDENGKSRSMSPDRRRKTRHVPRTPHQERVLVPDMSGQSPRRPSSIFGQKTSKWSSSRPTQCHEEERIEEESICQTQEDDLQPCSGARWQTPCGGKEYVHSKDTCSRVPSPPRRPTWSKEVHQMRDEKPAAFVVLKDKVEINNNNRIREDGNCDKYKPCCKEQKWMPPWYEQPK